LLMTKCRWGMGRSGKFWGYENLGIEPDVFFTDARKAGGGIPFRAIMCKSFCNVFNGRSCQKHV